jgi:hypothetical protein
MLPLCSRFRLLLGVFVVLIIVSLTACPETNSLVFARWFHRQQFSQRKLGFHQLAPGDQA